MHLQIRWFLNKAKQFTGSCGFRRGTLIKGSNYLEEFIINNNTFLSPSLPFFLSLSLSLSLKISRISHSTSLDLSEPNIGTDTFSESPCRLNLHPMYFKLVSKSHDTSFIIFFLTLNNPTKWHLRLPKIFPLSSICGFEKKKKKKRLTKINTMRQTKAACRSSKCKKENSCKTA